MSYSMLLIILLILKNINLDLKISLIKLLNLLFVAIIYGFYNLIEIRF